MRVMYFQDQDGKWRFRLFGGNNEEFHVSEAYEGGYGAALRGFDQMLENFRIFIESMD